MYATIHGGSIYIASNSGGLTIYEYSASSGSLIATHPTGVSAFSVRYITVDAAGGIYLVKNAKKNKNQSHLI
jgi:outer membrane protein assembly factor BamB